MVKTRKRGQVEINETILVLFIIVIIIAIGVFVYFRISIANVQETADDLSEQESTILLASVRMLQEISCGDRDCVDASKLLPFKSLANQHSDYYSKLLGYKKIEIEQVYPDVKGVKECTIELYAQEEYPENCRKWTIYDYKPSASSKSLVMHTFVSLYFPEVEEYRIGRLEVTSYV